MKTVYSLIGLDKEYSHTLSALSEQIEAKKPLPLVVNGLSGGALDSFCYDFVCDIRAKGRCALVIVPTESEAIRVSEMLRSEDIPTSAFLYRESVLYNISASHDSDRERLSTLKALLDGSLSAVVTTPTAAISYTMPPAQLEAYSLCLEVGKTLEIEELCDKLATLGFVHTDTLDGMGQFSRRGGIVDFFGGGNESPVRIEFFGDEIDRMGYFDIVSQRMQGTVDKVEILPAREVITDKTAREKIRKEIESLIKKGSDEAKKLLKNELAALDNDAELNYADKYVSLIYPEKTTLLDYFSYIYTNPVTLIFGTNEVNERLKTGLALSEENSKRLIDEGLVSAQYSLLSATKEDFDAFLEKSVAVHVNTFSSGVGKERLGGLFGFRCRRTVSYDGKLDMLLTDIKNYIASKYKIFLICRTDAERENMRDFLSENTIPSRIIDEQPLQDIEQSIVYITKGYLTSGFELIMARATVLSLYSDEAKAAYKQKKYRRFGKKQGAGEKLMSYADLSVGDYVVHASHGIGRFEGMKTLTVDGAIKDYITIAYAGTDKLFLPAERLEYVSKYIGARAEDGSVKLSKIGGTEWQKAKSRAKKATEDMARELIALYAARQRKEGYAYPPDSDLERAFDNSFEFEETEPQLAAIEEIKRDMMRPVPMDRLLCGDVGFGKTEVALRAAFKAVCAGKQVAILVPTTILALQHYQTALSRMRGYPITIDMISRFRTQTEQARIFRRLARGETDIIIGTHSLLGKRTEFKNLGLLIVDEEQRFGVGQKEKIKAMAENVDVLTLTATPIPRTLNMAMSGIRDMSILDEAPRDRFPVQSYVFEHDDLMISEAIRRELSRAGQVLYLYNRVEQIYTVASRIMRDIPEARVAVAHGKMEKEELEGIWQSLVQGDIDVLVCTTIIETGVDLPNANTLIVEDSDRLGLAQLHQIRGRVGRGGRQAYAYFTYRKGKALSDISRKRLEAIREFAEFGAGFKIALRDLEIRGAGNLLGAEQHGHIDSVGYDLYIRLLNEAILTERGDKIEMPFESNIEIKDDANIPESYISTSSARMEMYKKISLILEEDDLSDVLDELCDRFGEPPKATVRLLNVALLRAYASRCRISKVIHRDGELRFIPEKIDLSAWSEVFSQIDGMRFPSSLNSFISYKLKRGEDATEVAKKILTAYYKALFSNEEKANESKK